jgi:TRAP-type C4-dicarboxylate transport system substrate-binding protein
MIITKLSKYAAASALALSVSCAAVSADTLRLASSWASNQATYRVNVETFVALVEEYTNGEVDFDIIGPEAISPLELIEPLQAGIVDMVFTHPAYHAGTSAIGMAADGIAVDPETWRSAGITDAFDSYYQTLGIKVVSINPLGERGFRFVADQAIDGREHSFDGMLVRANASYIAIIEQLGGTPVPLPGGEIYSSLQNGVINAAPWSATGLVDFQLYEVASHVVQPDFGSLSNWFLMNLDAWNALDADTQAAIERAARETELFALTEMTRIADEELVTLQERGMEITRMNEHEAENIASWMSEAMWGLAAGTDSEVAASIRAIAVEAGLSN